MQREFYEQYRALQRQHWWFVGRRAIVIQTLRRALGEAGDLQLLDFGCGPGTFLPDLAAFGRVTGIDGDQAAVDLCHEQGFGDVRQLDAGAPLPFADATFDVVSALDVIEHIEDDGAALAEIARVSRPGAIVLLTVPAFPLLWGDQDEISHHFRRYRAVGLSERIAEAGLQLRHLSYFNTVLFAPVALLRVGRRLVRRPSADRTDFDVGPAWANAILTRLLAAEAPLASSRRLPFGVSLLAVASVP